MSYNQKQKLQDNIEALRVIKNRESYSPLTEEIETLRKWSGCGGLKGVLNDWAGTKEEWEQSGASKQDLSLYEKYQQFFSLIKEIFPFSKHKEVINSLKNSTLTAFYTPSVIPCTFYEVLSMYMTVNSLYEPSAGSGVFIEEAIKVFPEIQVIRAYEKDIVTAKILEHIYREQATVSNLPFEESDNNENGKYDLITSNIPFGEMKVFDPQFKDNNLTGKIHNYFFAKGIDKIKDGGILAYLVSDAFLNTVSNKTARKYVFDRCDFISLTIMPDNLMQDTGGTMAASHFLVVQKNTQKTELSSEEELLIESSFVENEGKKYAVNRYLQENPLTCLFKEARTKIGTNQYGKPSVEVHWNKSIEEIAEPFREILSRDFSKNFRQQIFRNPQQELLGKQAKWVNEQDFEEIAIDENLLKYNKEKWTPTTAATQKEIDEINNSVPYVNETGYHSKPKDETSPWEEKPVNIEIPELLKEKVEAIAELSNLLPEYIPFKEGIIIEYEK